MKDNLDYDEFSAPIPGESLTRIPGGSPYEQAPQFPDINDAMEYIFDTLVEPRQSARLITMLKHGATCESIVRTVLFVGFMSGKWTPDVLLLIARPTLYIIASIAERAKNNGLLNRYTIMNPDHEQINFMRGFENLMSLNEEKPISDSEISSMESKLSKNPIDTEDLSNKVGGLLGRGV